MYSKPPKKNRTRTSLSTQSLYLMPWQETSSGLGGGLNLTASSQGFIRNPNRRKFPKKWGVRNRVLLGYSFFLANRVFCGEFEGSLLAICAMIFESNMCLKHQFLEDKISSHQELRLLPPMMSSGVTKDPKYLVVLEGEPKYCGSPTKMVRGKSYMAFLKGTIRFFLEGGSCHFTNMFVIFL